MGDLALPFWCFGLLGIGTILSVEFFCRLPVASTLKGISGVARKAMHVLRSKRISDHWKELVMTTYSGQLIRSSLLLPILLLIGLIPLFLALVALVIMGQSSKDLIDFTLSMWGIAGMLVLSVVYLVVRQRSHG